MIKLATLLGVGDPENISAEAFYQAVEGGEKCDPPDSAEAYVRSVVCNLTRMRIRHLQVVRRNDMESLAESGASAQSAALLRDDRRALLNALRRLPTRQREALVLCHWLGLEKAEIAETIGISAGSVKTHTSRGLTGLTQASEARR